MNILKLLTVLTVIGFVGVYGFVQSGIFNVSAKTEDGPVLTWLLHTTMEKSVAKRATDIEVPDLSRKDMILAGLSDYAGMCAGCHGEPGKSPGIIKQGLNPVPPDLDHLAEEGTAAEMFWVISNGIRMTGMPAFGKSHQPEEIWPVVAFLQSARNITAADYTEMINKTKGKGHHGTESDEHDGDNDHQDHNKGSNDDDEDHGAHSHSELSSDDQTTSAISPVKPEVGDHSHGDEGNTHEQDQKEVMELLHNESSDADTTSKVDGGHGHGHDSNHAH